jgi:hypothetical protein
VLYVGKELLCGAREAMRVLNESGLPSRRATNCVHAKGKW